MSTYIFFFIIYFCLAYLLCLICWFKKQFILKNAYIIIPWICIGFWAINALYYLDFEMEGNDFGIFYLSGKIVVEKPLDLYNNHGYYGFFYLPIFAVIFAFTFSLLPHSISYTLFFFLNFLLGLLTLIEFDKILILKGLREKIHRFIFLFIISNGFYVFYQFRVNQTKYLLLLIFLFIIRRELIFTREGLKKNFKYYLINYNLLLLAIAIAPYFIFLLFIYIFHDIPMNEILKTKNILSYSIIIILFVLQNFLFVLYPSLIFEFLKGFFTPSHRHEKLKMLYLKDWVEISAQNMMILTYILTSLLILISFILIFKKHMQIDEKFSYFFLSYTFIGVYSYQISLSLILFTFILLLFVPYVKQGKIGILFLKENKILFLGLISIISISFLAYDFYDLTSIFLLNKNIINIIRSIILTLLLIAMMYSLFFLKLENRQLNNSISIFKFFKI